MNTTEQDMNRPSGTAGGQQGAGTDQVRDEAARLARFAHQLVWLNPLLRYEGFEPRKFGGIGHHPAGRYMVGGMADRWVGLIAQENLGGLSANEVVAKWTAGQYLS